MEVIRNHVISFPIDNESDIGICRRKGVNLANKMGFDKVKSGEIAILISELGTNVLKHGGGKGKMVISQYENGDDNKAIEIWCCDSGNGLVDYKKSMKDGISNTKTLGIGLGTISRFSDKIEIDPEVSSEFARNFFSDKSDFSHCIRLLKWIPAKTWIGVNKKLIAGAASRCHPGENLNGDSYLVNHVSHDVTVVAVIDGLGHGAEANRASVIAKEQILLNSELPLENLMKKVHESLRGTRGTTLGLARINTETNKLVFSGIGNIESFIISQEGKKNLLSYGGIMGHNMRTPRVFEFDFTPGDNLCMYSDGITTRWRHEDIVWTNPPQKNAEHILNKYSRINDDATILIISYTA